eukprot:m.266627 g.266627  ORF g.266627 m.266627 type:complete len:388 (+) comp19720_c1_seq34:2277-3440(+)
MQGNYDCIHVSSLSEITKGATCVSVVAMVTAVSGNIPLQQGNSLGPISRFQLTIQDRTTTVNVQVLGCPMQPPPDTVDRMSESPLARQCAQVRTGQIVYLDGFFVSCREQGSPISDTATPMLVGDASRGSTIVNASTVGTRLLMHRTSLRNYATFLAFTPPQRTIRDDCIDVASVCSSTDHAASAPVDQPMDVSESSVAAKPEQSRSTTVDSSPPLLQAAKTETPTLGDPVSGLPAERLVVKACIVAMSPAYGQEWTRYVHTDCKYPVQPRAHGTWECTFCCRIHVDVEASYSISVALDDGTAVIVADVLSSAAITLFPLSARDMQLRSPPEQAALVDRILGLEIVAEVCTFVEQNRQSWTRYQRHYRVDYVLIENPTYCCHQSAST